MIDLRLNFSVGLVLCCLDVRVGGDVCELIVMEPNDCALSVLGDSQEEHRRLISELVLHRMHGHCRGPGSIAVSDLSGAQLCQSIRAVNDGQHQIRFVSAPLSDGPERRMSFASRVAVGNCRRGGSHYIHIYFCCHVYFFL